MNKSLIKKTLLLFSLSCLLMLAVVEVNFNLKFARRIQFKEQSPVSRHQPNDQLKALLQVLCRMDVFLVDNERLSEIALFENSSFLEINFERFVFRENKRRFYTSFGLAYDKTDTIPEMLAVLYKDFGVECFARRYYTDSVRNKTHALTLVLLDCSGDFKIAINVFHERGDFLYIAASLKTQNNPHIKWYNDVPRALQRFDIATIKDSYLNEIKIPADLRRYFYDYGHSRFLECNSTLVEQNVKKSNGTYCQNKTKNEQIRPCIVHLTRQLEKLYKHYYLTSGSLLGWYRDCGLVPHTPDFDLTLWSYEYDNSIKDAFLGNPHVYLTNTMGRVRHSLEMRTKGCDFQYDLFFMYKITERKQCTYFHSSFKVFPGCFPIFNDFCSGELLHSKVIVPCEPESLLHQLYSYKTWETPKLSQYDMNSMLWYHGMNRSLTDLPYMHRYYAKNGSLLVNETLERINQEYLPITGRNLTELPSDENEYL